MKVFWIPLSFILALCPGSIYLLSVTLWIQAFSWREYQIWEWRAYFHYCIYTPRNPEATRTRGRSEVMLPTHANPPWAPTGWTLGLLGKAGVSQEEQMSVRWLLPQCTLTSHPNHHSGHPVWTFPCLFQTWLDLLGYLHIALPQKKDFNNTSHWFQRDLGFYRCQPYRNATVRRVKTLCLVVCMAQVPTAFIEVKSLKEQKQNPRQVARKAL